MAMKKYGKYFILIGIVSLALGVGFGLLIKTLVSEPEEKVANSSVEIETQFWNELSKKANND